MRFEEMKPGMLLQAGKCYYLIVDRRENIPYCIPVNKHAFLSIPLFSQQIRTPFAATHLTGWDTVKRIA
jgi:hypothetical protein